MNAVNLAIRQAGARWVAKANPVSRLSKAEATRMTGLREVPQGELSFEGLSAQNAASSVDWRNKDGVNWLGPVMNQGNCGSCVAFASVATLEAQTSISLGAPWLSPTYSPQALFACGGGGCETGWMPDSAADHLERTGVPDEACLPYTSGSTGKDVSCNLQCSDSKARSLVIQGTTTPTSYGGNVEAVKKALAKGPLVTTLMVYQDFLTYSSGVYSHVTGSAVGGHAVSLVGYDEAKRAWLIRNSWGKEWGDQGFAWVSWDDRSGIGANTWGFTIPAPNELASVNHPADRELISDKSRVEVQTSGSLASSPLSIHIRGGNAQQSVLDCSTQSGRCVTEIDTAALADGRYEIWAEDSAGKGLKSQVREFFVLNHEPQLSISFKGANNLNLSAPVRGRIEMDVTAGFGAVPMNRVEFVARKLDGTEVSIKSNPYVLSQMRMGWRSNTVPNGQYDILFRGTQRWHGRDYAVQSAPVRITVAN